MGVVKRKAKRQLGWHFVGATLRDGSAIPKDGEWLEFHGPLVLCESGLHFSLKPHQALQYAPGATLCLIEYGGKVLMSDDKGVCSRRRIVARMDATELLRFFARMQAVSVLHLWDTEPPEIVCDYLMTGDDELRAAAWAAAWDAAMAAAWAAAMTAARAAARAAARDAARDAAMAAAWAAASDAAWAAARDAAREAAMADFDSLVHESFEEFI